MQLIPSQQNKVLSVLKSCNIDLYTFTLHASYDIDLSRIYFNDFQQEIEGRSVIIHGRNGIEALYIFESKDAMNSKYFKEWKLKKEKKAYLFELCEKLDLIAWDQGETKQDLIDLLKNLDGEDYYKAYHEGTSYRDLDYDFYITGYSQGDKVLVTLIGDKDSDELKHLTESHLTNVFYDTPMDISVDVYLNGNLHETLSLSESLDVYGDYERKNVLNVLDNFKHLEYYSDLLEHLEFSLPENLEYSE